MGNANLPRGVVQFSNREIGISGFQARLMQVRVLSESSVRYSGTLRTPKWNEYCKHKAWV